MSKHAPASKLTPSGRFTACVSTQALRQHWMVWRAAAKDLEHAIAAQDTVQRERERLGRRDLGDDTGRLVGAGEAEFDVRVQAVDPQTHAQAHRIGRADLQARDRRPPRRM